MGASESKEFGELSPPAPPLSARAQELDKLGGLHRPAVKRGDSMDMKLQWLKAHLEKQGNAMESALNKNEDNARRELDKQEKIRAARQAYKQPASRHPPPRPPAKKEEVPKGVRKPSLSVSVADSSGKAPAKPKVATQKYAFAARPLSPTKKRELPPGLVKGVRVKTSNPASRASSRQSFSRSSTFRGSMRGSISRGLFTPKTPKRASLLPTWRQNVARAKRKLYVVARVIPRLSRMINGGKKNLSSIPRLDSFGFLLYTCLGPDVDRFIAEQTKVATLATKTAKLQRMLEQPAAAHSPSAPSRVGFAAPPPEASGASPAPPSTSGSADGSGADTTARVEAARLRSLKATLDADLEEVEKARKMMRMLANRCNARWLEGIAWDPPHTFSAVRFPQLLGGEEYQTYRGEAVKLMQEGRLAVQLLAADDNVLLPNGNATNLFTADPWALVEQCCPNRPALAAAPGERINGLTLGGRMLLALAMAVAAAAGKEAVAKMPVILSIGEDQEEPVLKDLRERSYYGFSRELVFIVPQRRRHCYGYSIDASAFVKDWSGAEQSAGPGYCSMQLMWEREAWSPSPNGLNRDFLHGSVLEALSQRGVEWMTVNRLSDLQRYSSEGVLEMDALALTLKLAADRGATMSFEVKEVEGQIPVRQQNSVVVSLQGDTRGQRGGGRDTARFAQDLKFSDLQSPKMTQALGELQAACGGKLTTNTHRYIFRLPALKLLLMNQQMWHPDLELRQHLVTLTFQMADLTTAPEACAAALVSKLPLSLLRAGKDLEEAVPLLQRQDRDAAVRAALSALKPDRSAAAVAKRLQEEKAARAAAAAAAGRPIAQTAASVKAAAAPALPCATIVAFLAENEASEAAANIAAALARPGPPGAPAALHFVTSVQEDAKFAAAQKLLDGHVGRCAGRVAIAAEVLVRGTQSLTECLESYADAKKADLVVMGSVALTRSDAAAMGSVSLSCLKRFRRPLLIVKAAPMNVSRQVAAGTEPLRAMMNVDHTARPLLNFLCSRLLDAERGDRLYLGRANAKDASNQDTMTTKRMLDQFGELAGTKGMAAIKRPLMGRSLDAIGSAAEADKAHFAAVQVPLGPAIPSDVVELLRSVRSGALIYKTNDMW